MPDETSPLLASDLSSESGATGTGVNGSPTPNDGAKQSNPALSFVIPMAIGIFIAAMDQTIVVSSYAAIGSELNQLQSTSWIATAYMLTLTSFQPLYGKLSDIFGRKSCLLVAYCIFALGGLLCGLSRNMTELIVSRAIAGIGAGGMATVVSIIMSDVVPLRYRGTWQGVLNIIFASGSAVGAPLGGFFVDTIGWRWAFLCQVPMAILAIVCVSLALHLPKMEPTDFSVKLKRVDLGGAVTLVLTIFLLLLGLDRAGNISWADNLTILSFGGFAVCFILFSIIELKLASEPFAPKHIIINRSLIAGFLVNFFGGASAISMIFNVSLYLQAVKDKSASEAGLWLILSVVGGLIGSLAGGLTMQATGKFYAVTVGGYFVMFIGAGVIVLMTGVLVQSFAGLAVGLLVISIGNGCGITTSLIALIANAGQADQAIATAISYLFRSLGLVVGVSVGSTLAQEALRSYLRRNLSGQDVEEIIQRVRESLTYIDKLDPFTQVIVRGGYAVAIRAALSFTLFMAACSLVASIFIKEKALPANR